ncbi:MAG: hypothetical protein AAGA56_17830, partial [Myxococcota bacterium]
MAQPVWSLALGALTVTACAAIAGLDPPPGPTPDEMNQGGTAPTGGRGGSGGDGGGPSIITDGAPCRTDGDCVSRACVNRDGGAERCEESDAACECRPWYWAFLRDDDAQGELRMLRPATCTADCPSVAIYGYDTSEGMRIRGWPTAQGVAEIPLSQSCPPRGIVVLGTTAAGRRTSLVCLGHEPGVGRGDPDYAFLVDAAFTGDGLRLATSGGGITGVAYRFDDWVPIDTDGLADCGTTLPPSSRLSLWALRIASDGTVAVTCEHSSEVEDGASADGWPELQRSTIVAPGSAVTVGEPPGQSATEEFVLNYRSDNASVIEALTVDGLDEPRLVVVPATPQNRLFVVGRVLPPSQGGLLGVTVIVPSQLNYSLNASGFREVLLELQVENTDTAPLRLEGAWLISERLQPPFAADRGGLFVSLHRPPTSVEWWSTGSDNASLTPRLRAGPHHLLRFGLTADRPDNGAPPSLIERAASNTAFARVTAPPPCADTLFAHAVDAAPVTIQLPDGDLPSIPPGETPAYHVTSSDGATGTSALLVPPAAEELVALFAHPTGNVVAGLQIDPRLAYPLPDGSEVARVAAVVT